MDTNKNPKDSQSQTKKLFTQKTPEARKKQFFKIAMALAIVIVLILLYKSFANINTRTANNISLNYDINTIKQSEGKIECIKDDRILQWHEGKEMWECKKPTSSVFGELDKHNVKVNDSGNLECKEDNKALIWEDDQWACGELGEGQNLEFDNNELSISDGNSVDLSSLKTDDVWSLDGNSDVNDDYNFIGTANNEDLVFKTDGEERMRIDDDGYIVLPNTTHDNPDAGVIYKDDKPFIHDFNYGDNGTVETQGDNIFIGKNAGNFTMGSTATSTVDASTNIGIGTDALSSLRTCLKSFLIKNCFK